MKLPWEIYFYIIREATYVPEAFDTSPSIINESRGAVVQLIHESMLTKTALSLVSKGFHDIMEQFLYEIVMIFRFDFVPPLLKLLRSTPPGRHYPRGHACRRLEFYLGTGSLDYPDTAWYEGGHTLWGLIPSCPRLEILLCRVVYKDSTRSPMVTFPEYPHLTHTALWKTMARYCAGTLRRLELYGFHIRMDRVEMMLRYFSKLEACRIADVVAFDDKYFHHEEYSFDDEEPLRMLVNFGWRRVFLYDTTKGVPSGWFDTETRTEFDEAKRTASWPPFEGTVPYVLPALHTLLLDNFNIGVTQFRFPGLRNLGVYNCRASGMQLCADAHSTFPSSVTRLIHKSCGISVSALLAFYPHIIHLTLDIQHADFYPSTFSKPHPSLSVVKMTRGGTGRDMMPYVRDMLFAVRSEMLPSLRTIEITQFKADTRDDVLLFEESEALGVALLVTTIRPFALSGRCTWHD